MQVVAFSAAVTAVRRGNVRDGAGSVCANSGGKRGAKWKQAFVEGRFSHFSPVRVRRPPHRRGVRIRRKGNSPNALARGENNRAQRGAFFRLPVRIRRVRANAERMRRVRGRRERGDQELNSDRHNSDATSSPLTGQLVITDSGMLLAPDFRGANSHHWGIDGVEIIGQLVRDAVQCQLRSPFFRRGRGTHSLWPNRKFGGRSNNPLSPFSALEAIPANRLTLEGLGKSRIGPVMIGIVSDRRRLRGGNASP